MREYDDAVLECFLDKQLQLFPLWMMRFWKPMKSSISGTADT